MVKAYVKEVGFGPQDDIFGAHYTPAHINRDMYKKTIMCYLKKHKFIEIDLSSQKQ